MVTLTINDQKIKAEKGLTVLRAAESSGIKIPTLCSHKALSPYGACRICLVEISQDGRPPTIQASCTYPALPGLIIKTDSERVIKTRKIMIELLWARCPDSEDISNLAKELGVGKTRIKPKNKDCSLCGLCVRMCHERMGRSAISFSGRGPKREVTSPFGVPSEVCQACGACDFICPTGKIRLHEVSKNEPVPIPFEHNEGLISRSAVYIPYPQAIPNKATIDDRYCVHLLRDKCEICKEFCEAEAIDYEQKEQKVDLQVGSVILAPGYELFNANSKLEYGYWLYSNVITALEFERILSASGPYSGIVLRPSDKCPPRRIAFIQCVGSRDDKRNYCSSICCMYATKEAIIAKEHAGEELDCHIFYIDIRAFSKGFEKYYERAKELGVKFIKCRPSSIDEIDGNNLRIQYLTDDGKISEEEYDLVVLSTGLQPPGTVEDISKKFDIKLNHHGFCWTSPFRPIESNKKGVFVCGPFTEPKDIPETVMQASGAAAGALSLLSDVRGSLIQPKVFPPEKDISGQDPLIGVFICHCGTNIAGVINVPEVVEYAQTLPDVVYAENNLYTCSNDTQDKIKDKINEYGINRVVVASCTPRTHEPMFRNTIHEAGLNPYLFEMANIRDQCSWTHMNEPEKATIKAKDLVRMAVAKARLIEPLYSTSITIKSGALVIGGGIAGMTASLSLAEQGFEVNLVEKEQELGGNMRHIHYLLGGEDPRKELDDIIRKLDSHPNIKVWKNASIESIDGFVGNFTTKIKQNKKEIEVEHGVVIVASGAKEYAPTEYLYGSDDNIISQRELEKRLAEKKFDAKNVVMIQCVGSREEGHMYCSRVCCSIAVKNALKIKEVSPDTEVFVLYRDMRTYGFNEEYYRQARNEKVLFIRYDTDGKPEVTNDENIEVSVNEPLLGQRIVLQPDLLVLSSRIDPNTDNETIAKMLKIPLNQDGFFLEAHMKLRPVDFATEGVFLAGLAHSPKNLTETIAQGEAVAGRAATIISKKEMNLSAMISEVVDANCDGCAYCIDPCPYNALKLIEFMRNGAIKKTVEQNEALCKG
ncbi:MAG: FAD-dependent oxidoreductase, partial [Candidatus Latescibacteria bacterium]|nr:FAD-dependent oxidoreductase [Candidatus Latescibacterota bacterium]